jgi:hypothetical protein
MPLRKVRGVIVGVGGVVSESWGEIHGVGWESGLAMKLEVYDNGVKLVME